MCSRARMLTPAAAGCAHEPSLNASPSRPIACLCTPPPSCVQTHFPLATSVVDEVSGGSPHLRDLRSVLTAHASTVKLVLTGHFHKARCLPCCRRLFGSVNCIAGATLLECRQEARSRAPCCSDCVPSAACLLCVPPTPQGLDWQALYPFPVVTLPAVRYSPQNFFLLSLTAAGEAELLDLNKNRGGARCSDWWSYGEGGPAPRGRVQGADAGADKPAAMRACVWQLCGWWLWGAAHRHRSRCLQTA